MGKIYRAGGNGEEITGYKYSPIFKESQIEHQGKVYILDPVHGSPVMPGDIYMTERDFGIEVFTCKVGGKDALQIGSVELRGGLPVWRYPQECRRVVRVD